MFGERSLKSAESMQNLATVLDYLSETEQAGNLLTKALNIEEEVPESMIYNIALYTIEFSDTMYCTSLYCQPAVVIIHSCIHSCTV